MTAFDNIKTNNWPASSNDFEDFLVLKMSLNGSASLTESLPVVAGSQELSPKRTLTNTGAYYLAPDDVIGNATITGNRWDATHDMKSAFRVGFDTYGQPGAPNSGAFASNGGSYKITFGNGGYPVSQNIVIKFWINGGNLTVNDGENDEHMHTTGEGSGYQTWTIASTDISQLKNIELNNSGNTGPYFSGLYVDGVQIVHDPKKHYANNVHFGSNKYISIPQDTRFDLGTEPFTLECYVKTPDASTGYPIIIGRWGSGGDSNFNNIWDWRPRASDNGGRWCFRVPDVSGGPNGIIDGGASVTDFEWHHIAVSRSGNTWRMFTDGQLTNTVTNSNTIPPIDGPLNLARGYHTFNGSIQDLRFYKGVAKYTSNFTPPGAILS